MALASLINDHNEIGGCIYAPSNVERVRYAYAHGHQLASHTWAHKHLPELSREEGGCLLPPLVLPIPNSPTSSISNQVNSEMELTETAIQQLTGAHVAFTRPPFGAVNDDVLDVAAQRGQAMVNWDHECVFISRNSSMEVNLICE